MLSLSSKSHHHCKCILVIVRDFEALALPVNLDAVKLQKVSGFSAPLLLCSKLLRLLYPLKVSGKETNVAHG